MITKIRKVGNSFVVTIPSECMESLNLRDGQEMEVNTQDNILGYIPLETKKPDIDWNKYSFNKPIDLRDGLEPTEYVRSLRDNDREILL